MDRDRYEIFRRDMPAAYLQDCLLGLFESYLSAAESCWDRFEPPQAVNVLWAYRRGMIEEALQSATFGVDGVKFTIERGGSWNHTLVSAGECIMTQATVKVPDDVVQSTYARQAYAEPDNQRYLSFVPATPSQNGLVFAMLIHGREPPERFFPAFAHIVFPNRNLLGYFSKRIDLFKEFPEVVRRCTSGIFNERHETLNQQFGTIAIPEPELRDDIGEAFA